MPFDDIDKKHVMLMAYCLSEAATFFERVIEAKLVDGVNEHTCSSEQWEAACESAVKAVRQETLDYFDTFEHEFRHLNFLLVSLFDDVSKQEQED